MASGSFQRRRCYILYTHIYINIHRYIHSYIACCLDLVARFKRLCFGDGLRLVPTAQVLEQLLSEGQVEEVGEQREEAREALHRRKRETKKSGVSKTNCGEFVTKRKEGQVEEVGEQREEPRGPAKKREGEGHSARCKKKVGHVCVSSVWALLLGVHKKKKWCRVRNEKKRGSS